MGPGGDVLLVEVDNAKIWRQPSLRRHYERTTRSGNSHHRRHVPRPHRKQPLWPLSSHWRCFLILWEEQQQTRRHRNTTEFLKKKTKKTSAPYIWSSCEPGTAKRKTSVSKNDLKGWSWPESQLFQNCMVRKEEFILLTSSNRWLQSLRSVWY